MIKKISYSVFITLFIIIFSYINWWEYINFYNENKKTEELKIILNEELKNFSFENIKQLDNTEIFYTPEEKVLEKIINKIDEAKEKIYIEVYMLTEKRITKALKNAKEKWLEIKVVLEKNPYGSFNINDKTYDFLKNLNIDVVWSNPKNYALNHSKLIIIDNEAIISTWNLTHSTFIYNRDFFIFTKNKIIVEKLNEIFLYDFEWKINFIYNNNLILSPSYSREKLEYLIENSKEKLDLYFQYLQDDELEELLIKKIKKWIKISIIISENWYNDDEVNMKKLESAWIKIKKMEKYTMHSKAILVDDNYLFIWSINFSTYSIDKNREIWIILKDENINKKFLNIFNKDFN